MQAIYSSCPSIPKRIIVVANGCSDNTAELCRAEFPDVLVLETPYPSKSAALNIGDSAAGNSFPRFYVDADLVLGEDAVEVLLEALDIPGVMAAAPKFEFDTARSNCLIRAFYRAWNTLPYFDSGRIAGAYVVSEVGRSRFDFFPDVISDDGFIRLHFLPEERVTLMECFVKVRTPRSMRELIKVRTRSVLGTFQLRKLYPELFVNEQSGQSETIRRIFVNPRYWLDYIVYILVTLIAKVRAISRLRSADFRWERDESSRQSGELEHDSRV